MSLEDQFDYQQLDDILHSRIRTAIMAILHTVDKAEFKHLKKQTKATDGNLSTHLKKLESAGYIEVEKKFEKRKPVTTYWLTDKGRKAFCSYIASLEKMLGR